LVSWRLMPLRKRGELVGTFFRRLAKHRRLAEAAQPTGFSTPIAHLRNAYAMSDPDERRVRFSGTSLLEFLAS
jgi:hypothetical protein